MPSNAASLTGRLFRVDELGVIAALVALVVLVIIGAATLMQAGVNPWFGARLVVWSGLSTSHVQGTARMGADPARSVVDDRSRAHGVDGLYVGDGSVTGIAVGQPRR